MRSVLACITCSNYAHKMQIGLRVSRNNVATRAFRVNCMIRAKKTPTPGIRELYRYIEQRVNVHNHRVDEQRRLQTHCGVWLAIWAGVACVPSGGFAAGLLLVGFFDTCALMAHACLFYENLDDISIPFIHPTLNKTYVYVPPAPVFHEAVACDPDLARALLLAFIEEFPTRTAQQHMGERDVNPWVRTRALVLKS